MSAKREREQKNRFDDWQNYHTNQSVLEIKSKIETERRVNFKA